MNHDIKNMIKDSLILFAITLIAGLVLGVVYQVTKDPIAAQQEKAKQEACKEVFAEAVGFSVLEAGVSGESGAQGGVLAGEDGLNTPQDASWAEQGFEGVDIGEVLSAEDADGNILGYVITISDHEGYGGDIEFMMGVGKDGTLNGISLLSISETAGLGMRAEEVLKPQFEGKSVERFEYVKGNAAGENQIDAISGATITTHAVTNGVNAGLHYFHTVLMGGGNGNEE